MKIHVKPTHRVTARDAGAWPMEVHVQTDVGEVCLSLTKQASDELDKLIARNEWPAEWPVETNRGCATLVLTRTDALMVKFPKPEAD
jgi:hypothetical protein